MGGGTPLALLALLVCAVAVSGEEHASPKDLGSCPRLADRRLLAGAAAVLEAEEAIDAGSFLLQVGVERPMAQPPQVQALAALKVRIMGLLMARQGVSNASLADLWQPYVLAMANLNTSASDPIWTNIYDEVRADLLSNPTFADFVQLCTQGELDAYTAKACAADAAGSILVRGIPGDAYYCGSQNWGINWTTSAYPVHDLCDAQYGSAFTAAGVCGSLSKKQLVLNFFDTVPSWQSEPQLINVPSLECILGLTDCDIYYCQHCSGRCSGPQ